MIRSSDRPSASFFREPEDPFGGAIPQQDRAVGAGGDDRIPAASTNALKSSSLLTWIPFRPGRESRLRSSTESRRRHPAHDRGRLHDSERRLLTTLLVASKERGRSVQNAARTGRRLGARHAIVARLSLTEISTTASATHSFPR